MSTLAQYQPVAEFFQRNGHMQNSEEEPNVFSTGYLRHCNSADIRPFQAENERASRRPRFSDSGSDTPEELVALSFDLLNQIQQHELKESSDVASHSRETHSPDSPVVQSADSSSSYSCNSFTEDLVGELNAEGFVTDFSSGESHSSISYSPCDSVKGSTKGICAATGKPLYTAELQVMCRICGDRASGFHYGVHSCEGCKGFFRRTLKKGLVYKPCKEHSRCRINAGSRNKCQFCRYLKCLNAGMSQNAVRFGRMPKSEREKLVADKEELSSSCSTRIMELRYHSDTLKGAFQECFSHCTFLANFMSKSSKVQSQPVKADSEHLLLAGDLNSQDFHEKMIFQCYQATIVPALEGLVKYTKRIPHFSSLDILDRVLLVKRNGFCVITILCHMLCENNAIQFEGPEPGQQVSILLLGDDFRCWEAQQLLEGIFQIARKMARLHLSTTEIALLCAIVILLESPGVKDAIKVEDLQTEAVEALRLELKHNHPKERYLLPRILLLIPQLVSISEEFHAQIKGHLFDPSEKYSNTHELLVEIFDLN
ncbi:peroxisome proliferator-activated receptor delta-like [Mya arenaria]|uniref:peroxisome proliferator-activated receptor delta-like n=1 Tax=Mya arenaria TaxID=6604 RepID=UPI0022E9530D|nr:peroxisome proliferator-activated receptor delta-like [Mya arenaria]